ncbi:hypothetical protein AXG93_40s1000 [Marchantia polymorpha subsp. ruderalis]|uniref:Uncharacterized protein n=1 Tax=Marchantia polymorpha subsp. ruderalis TaxID=1480154 RepID=A0A176WE83_MARPO|nr:hypothetical protein AXG93_40s1000 [Marchantia polymorpha subsp. ruderalis]
MVDIICNKRQSMDSGERKIQVSNGGVKRLEYIFLLDLIEQQLLDGANIFTVSGNCHLFIIGAVHGDGFIMQLKMDIQFEKPYTKEMKSLRIEWLHGLSSRLEVVQQLDDLFEHLSEDLLGVVFFFALIQQVDGFIKFGGQRLKHDKETVKAR